MKSERSLINIYIIVISVLIIIVSPIKNISLNHLPSNSSICKFTTENHLHSQTMHPITKINIESVFSHFNFDDFSTQTNTSIQTPISNQPIKFRSLENKIILFDNHRLIILRI
jgi:hypothetical protein